MASFDIIQNESFQRKYQITRGLKKMIQMSNSFDFKNSNKIQMPVSLRLTYRYYTMSIAIFY